MAFWKTFQLNLTVVRNHFGPQNQMLKNLENMS
jgi:hypothetical protein